MNRMGLISILCGWMLVYTGVGATKTSENLVGRELLKQANLQSVWQIQLPLKQTEQIDVMYLFENYLYVLTDQNFFFCVERDSGVVHSIVSIAVPGLPILPPIHFEKRSVFLVGQELKVFDPAAGQIIRTLKLSLMQGNFGGIARNKDTFFVCGSDDRLYAFSVNEGILLYMVTADNDTPIYSVIAADPMVWFATTDGNVVAMATWQHQKVWQFNLSGKMKAPLLAEDGFIYAGGLDTKVYKIDAKTGKAVWKEPFYAGGAIKKPMSSGKSCVYVFTDITGLYAVNKQSGKDIWNQPNGCAILSEMDSQCFVYVQPGVLKLMDNVSGKEQLSVAIGNVDRYAHNIIDSSLYLANKTGLVMAAKPVTGEKPGPTKP